MIDHVFLSVRDFDVLDSVGINVEAVTHSPG